MSGTGDIIRCSTCGFDFRLAYGHQCIGSGVQIDTDRTALKEENKKLREALMFYANTGNYCVIHPYNENDPKTFSPVIQDEGKIAKKALADSSQGEK